MGYTESLGFHSLRLKITEHYKKNYGLNIDASNVAAVDVKIVDTSASVTAHVVKAAPVPVNGSLVAVGGNQKVVLETGDKINVTSATANSDVIISLLETT